jgi:hypothetical protein
LAGFAIFAFVLHILYRGYGFFREELYFIACSKHLAWGYVDQPAGVAVLAWLGRHLFGDNLFAVRFFLIVFGDRTASQAPAWLWSARRANNCARNMKR